MKTIMSETLFKLKGKMLSGVMYCEVYGSNKLIRKKSLYNLNLNLLAKRNKRKIN